MSCSASRYKEIVIDMIVQIRYSYRVNSVEICMAVNPYDILGVGLEATSEEIKKAYHDSAKEYHPDAGGDAKKFALVKLCYDTLKDKKKRKQYDDTGVIDESNESEKVGKAIGQLQKIFLAILQKTDPDKIQYTNIIGQMQEAVLKQMQDSIVQYDNLVESEIKTKKAVKVIERKLKRKGKKPNFMLGMLYEIVNGMATQKFQLKQQQETLEEMMQILKEFTYDFENEPYKTPGDRVMDLLGATYC